MDINTSRAILSPSVKQSLVKDQRIQAQPKATESNDRDDMVTLSPKAQQINKTTAQQNTIFASSFANNEQIRYTVNQLVMDIQSKPDLALSAVGNVNSSAVSGLLG